jgi:hypothetical protein
VLRWVRAGAGDVEGAGHQQRLINQTSRLARRVARVGGSTFELIHLVSRSRYPFAMAFSQPLEQGPAYLVGEAPCVGYLGRPGRDGA